MDSMSEVVDLLSPIGTEHEVVHGSKHSLTGPLTGVAEDYDYDV